MGLVPPTQVPEMAKMEIVVCDVIDWIAGSWIFFQAFSEKVWWFSQLETSIPFKVQGFASHVWFPKGLPINLPLNPIKQYKTL